MAYTEEGRWVTIRGRRVFIAEGETPSQAIERSKKAEYFLKKPQSKSMGGTKRSRPKSDRSKNEEADLKKYVDAELKKLGITREQASKDLYAEHTRRDLFLNKDGSKKSPHGRKGKK